ncbi:DUF7266 family protein [Halalkalicoccus subterraneus]|uniref:DUF7266 family protein n=1 Tax=Halalkalicoccus subterraneus TaxID=2675002 RepID=UPI000EFACC0B|nr:hypothetical protein [Halalkalicoccus subterraneus]
MSRSERATSVALGYVLTLSITTILVSGLFITAGSVVDDQRQQATTGELTVHGERLAADLATVDRLARTGSTVELERELPAAVAGATYRIEIDGERLVLRGERADDPVTVSFVAERDVEIAGSGSLGGGPVVIAFEDGTIEVRNG